MTTANFPEITAHTALRHIREAVKEGKIRWLIHAMERLDERGISTRQVIDCLLKGQLLDGLPEIDDRGHWRAVVSHRVAGMKLTVVAALTKTTDTGSYAVVITAYR